MVTFNFTSKQFDEIVNVIKKYKHIDNLDNYSLIELDTNVIRFISDDPNIEPISIHAEVNVTTCVYFDKVKIIVGIYMGVSEWNTMIEANIV